MGAYGSLIASSPAYPRGNPFGPTTVRSALVGSSGSSILTPCLSQYSTIRRAHRTLCRSISSRVSASLIVYPSPVRLRASIPQENQPHQCRRPAIQNQPAMYGRSVYNRASCVLHHEGPEHRAEGGKQEDTSPGSRLPRLLRRQPNSASKFAPAAFTPY